MSGLFSPNVDTPKSEPNRLDDLTVTDSAYGNMIPIVFGTQRVGGNIIFATDLIEQRKTRRTDTGGKGGGSTQTEDEVYYEYSASFAILFGEGTAAELLRLWMDRKLIYSRFGETLEKDGVQFTFYEGTETQTADPTIAAIHPDTPAYRGLCYAVFSNLVLTDYGNRIPQVTAEINFGSQRSRVNVVSGTIPHVVNWDNVVADWERRRLYLPRLNGIDVYDIASLKPKQTALAYSGTPSLIGLSPSTGELITSTQSINPYSGFSKSHVAALVGNNGVGITELTETGTNRWFLTRSDTHIYWYDEDYTSIPNTTWGRPTRSLSNIAVGVKGSGVAFVADYSTTITVYKIEAEGRVTALFNVTAANVGFSNLTAGSNILLFDHVTGSLILGVSSGSLTKLVKVTQTGNFDWQPVAVSFLPDVNENNLIRGGYLTYVNATAAVKIKVSDGTVVHNGLTGTYGDNNSFCNSALEVVINRSATTDDVTFHRRRFDSGDSDTVNVRDIISNVCNRVELKNSQLNVSDVTESIPGYTISKRTTPSRIIDPLGKIFNFDSVESNGRIYFTKRDKTSPNAIEIKEEDFIRKSNKDHFKEYRKQDSDLPMEVNLNFIDPERDYERNSATAKRQVAPFRAVSSDTKNSVTLPATLTAEQAKNAVSRYLFAQWAERTTYSLQLSQRYLYLDPLDTPTIILGEGANEFRFQGRIQNHDIGADYSTKTKLARQNAGQYASELTAYGGISFDPRSLQTGQTVPFVLDLPLLHDSHEQAGAMTGYVTANHYGPSEEWKGAALYRSVDTLNWDPIAEVKIEVGWGTTQTILNNPESYERTDTINTLDVTMIDGELESVEEIEMLNGKNSFVIIKDNGDTPILQFQYATSLGNNSYRLSNLLRGRRGTQTLDRGYLGGETILFLKADSVKPYPIPIDDRNVVRFYRGSTFGEIFDLSEQYTHKHSGRDLIPYPPVLGTASQTDATITLNWVRQTRLGGEADLLDGVSNVPVSETSESYDLEILDNNGIIVHDAFNIPSPSYTYTTTAEDGILTVNHSLGSNMDFEDHDTSWVLSNASRSIDSLAKKGYWFLLLSASNGTSNAVQTIALSSAQTNGIAASSSIELNIYSKFLVSSLAGHLSLKIECISNNSVVKTASSTRSNLTNFWDRFTLTLTAPPTNTTHIRLTIQITDTSLIRGWVDDCSCFLKNPRPSTDDNTISFRVYQNSAVVGRGYAGEFLNTLIS